MNATDTNMIIYNTQDGRASVVLYARDGSVWMNQNQLAELFDTSKPNISMHISNILSEKELHRDSVVKNYLTTAALLPLTCHLSPSEPDRDFIGTSSEPDRNLTEGQPREDREISEGKAKRNRALVAKKSEAIRLPDLHPIGVAIGSSLPFF